MAHKSYSYYCKDLNTKKYKMLLDKAVALRNFRNDISTKVCSSIESFNKYANLSEFDWINDFRKHIPSCNSQDISHAISTTFTSYDNKIKIYKKQLSIKLQDNIEFSYYKKNTNIHKKGDINSIHLNMKYTKFTKAISYLCKYWSPNLIEFLRTNKSDKEKINEFRKTVLFYYDKYPERITTLVNSIRERVVSRLIAHPINYVSLSYTSCNELHGSLLKRNNNKRSTFGGIITFGAQNTDTGKLFIPVKHNKKYHGNIEDYQTKPNGKRGQTTSYTVCFDKKNTIRIVLSKNVADIILPDTENYLGVDVNVKNNLFATSTGTKIDFDRDLFDDYIKWIKKCDDKIKRKKALTLNTSFSIRDYKTQEKCKTRIKDMLKRKAHNLVDLAIKAGKNHIVMEDLGSFAKSFSRSDEFMGFKYSRLIKLLNLTDLKNIVSSIANKKGINVSFVQSCFTSIACDCGNITKDNRKTQEVFSCTECNFTMDADVHSACLIENRMADDVLKAKLLNKVGSHYIPKPMSKDRIKSILHDHYTQKWVIDGNQHLDAFLCI